MHNEYFFLEEIDFLNSFSQGSIIFGKNLFLPGKTGNNR